jgi:hypothetical protein
VPTVTNCPAARKGTVDDPAAQPAAAMVAAAAKSRTADRDRCLPWPVATKPATAEHRLPRRSLHRAVAAASCTAVSGNPNRNSRAWTVRGRIPAFAVWRSGSISCGHRYDEETLEETTARRRNRRAHRGWSRGRGVAARRVLRKTRSSRSRDGVSKVLTESYGEQDVRAVQCPDGQEIKTGIAFDCSAEVGAAEEGDRPGAQHQSRVRGRRTALTNVVVFLSAHTKTVGPGATAPDPPWFVQATQKSCVTPDSVPW